MALTSVPGYCFRERVGLFVASNEKTQGSGCLGSLADEILPSFVMFCGECKSTIIRIPIKHAFSKMMVGR